MFSVWHFGLIGDGVRAMREHGKRKRNDNNNTLSFSNEYYTGNTSRVLLSNCQTLTNGDSNKQIKMKIMKQKSLNVQEPSTNYKIKILPTLKETA